MSGISQSIASPIARSISSPLAGGGGVPVFESFWDTTKLSTGSSNATSIKIPTVSDGTYNCVVDWGDGTFDTITTWDDPAWEHDYGVGNDRLKTVRITGVFVGFSCIEGDSSDKLKLLRIESWGQTGNGLVNGNRFDGCSNLVSIAKFDLPGPIVAAMFRSCTKLTSLDVSGWDVSNATNMYQMFRNCNSLTALDVSSWDVSSVTSMVSMFANCNSLTALDVSSWDVSSVTSMYQMFTNCSSLTSLDVSGWDVSNVTNMSQMFYNCPSLTSLDVSGWDVSSVTNMITMFSHANMTNEKYSDTLENWSLLTIKPNVNFSAGIMKYLARAATARGILTGAPNNWTITDGGLAA